MAPQTPTNDQIRKAATGSIVVGIDGSPHSDTALAWAARQARLENRALVTLYAADSALAYSRVWTDGVAIDHVQMMRDVETEGRRLADDHAARARDLAPGIEVRPLVTLSDARHALLEAGEVAALLVLGSRGRGLVGALLMGSVSTAIGRHAACPVVILRPGAEEHTGGVVVGVDGRASSGPVLDFAFRQASLSGKPLTVLHTHVDQIGVAYGLPTIPDTAEAEEAARTLAEAVAGFTEKFPEVEVTRTLRGEAVDRALLTADAEASLIVVGRRDGGLLASIHMGAATAVLEHAATAVAVVPTS